MLPLLTTRFLCMERSIRFDTIPLPWNGSMLITPTPLEIGEGLLIPSWVFGDQPQIHHIIHSEQSISDYSYKDIIVLIVHSVNLVFNKNRLY